MIRSDCGFEGIATGIFGLVFVFLDSDFDNEIDPTQLSEATDLACGFGRVRS